MAVLKSLCFENRIKYNMPTTTMTTSPITRIFMYMRTIKSIILCSIRLCYYNTLYTIFHNNNNVVNIVTLYVYILYTNDFTRPNLTQLSRSLTPPPPPQPTHALYRYRYSSSNLHNIRMRPTIFHKILLFLSRSLLLYP